MTGCTLSLHFYYWVVACATQQLWEQLQYRKSILYERNKMIKSKKGITSKIIYLFQIGVYIIVKIVSRILQTFQNTFVFYQKSCCVFFCPGLATLVLVVLLSFPTLPGNLFVICQLKRNKTQIDKTACACNLGCNDGWQLVF